MEHRCTYEGCDLLYSAKGLCKKHYMRQRHTETYVKKGRAVAQGCSVDSCNRRVNTSGMCGLHHYRRTKGLPLDAPVRAKGWHKNADGYIIRKYKGQHQAQHRVVMAEMIGRDLYRHETPHHKNGQRDDNRPENLELWSTSQPPGQRVEDKVDWAKEFLAQYETLSIMQSIQE